MEPRKLGRYVIERVLGKGAMGVVYLARDPVIGRQVALKTLSVPADLEEAEEFQARFLREAQAAGILNHPGIVTVHDAGVDETSGLSFIAMEYIEGRSLKELVKSGRGFAFSEVASVGAALAGALHYAHSKGVVHRDIKPANIIITPTGVVKITDFGVARLDSSNLTTTGQFIGTPNYMSPEQVTGSTVDGRSDLFSVGVVLFELLTGARPFAGGSLSEVAYRIVHAPAPIPSQLRPGLPPAFNPIILKLLEKDVERRYQRGEDVARALEALRRVLSGSISEVTRHEAVVEEPRPEETTSASMTSSPTVTRATTLERRRRVVLPEMWRRPIALRWTATLLALAVLPPAVIIGTLLARIDHGPWPGPPPGEPQRRHQVGAAQHAAAAALAAGKPREALQLLDQVWDQAPYSLSARRLMERARDVEAEQREALSRQEQALRLREEGQESLRQGRWRTARERFEAALDLMPDDPLARAYLELANDRLSAAAARGAVRTQPVPADVRPTPSPVSGEARLEVYFNSPISSGTVELRLDGKPLGKKPFDFYTKGFLGIRKRGTGVFTDAYTVRSGSHSLQARLLDEGGATVGEQTLPANLAAGGRYVLKIEMDGERAVPRFSLTEMKRALGGGR